MFCPRCGQERISQDTSFCSRCGFLLTGAAELLLTDGMPTSGSMIARKDSRRRRGLKQGFFIILLMLVLAPIMGLISRFAFDMIPWPMGVIVFLLGGGGLLRIIYALMFESGVSGVSNMPARSIAGSQTRQELPAGDTSAYVSPTPLSSGHWLDTNDLEPRSVTDATTQLLENEQDL